MLELHEVEQVRARVLEAHQFVPMRSALLVVVIDYERLDEGLGL